jgi:hypothetical protein
VVAALMFKRAPGSNPQILINAVTGYVPIPLVNALTGEVKTEQKHLSGDATNQEFVESVV